MKNIFLSICVIGLMMPTVLSAQTGRVFDDLSVTSSILKSERKYAIYLPPDYETSERSYPVLYLLHGGGDDQTGWVQFGEVLSITDNAIKDGSATAMIIVMPDANNGRRGYFNDINREWLYEDFFFQEFMPFIEKTYRIKGEKRYRAIAGLSMGGGGAYIYALHHPELFKAACPLSAATSYYPFNAREKIVKGTFTDDTIEAFYENHNVVEIINNMDEKQKNEIRWFIDCGDDDRLNEGNVLVHIAMQKKEITHEFRIRDGGHNWTYWRDSLPEVLKFISKYFHQF